MSTTPYSLLERLRNPADCAGHADAPNEMTIAETADQQRRDWSRFNELYTPILYEIAQRLRLPDDDAKELVAEVWLSLRQAIPEGKYEREKGKFRFWLLSVVRNKWNTILRRRAVRSSAQEPLEEEQAIPDNVEQFLQDDYNAMLAARALQIMKSEFKEVVWRACWETVVNGLSAAEAAELLGIDVKKVYADKFRVLARLREELRDLWLE